MKQFKKYLSILAITIMILGAFSIPATAASSVKVPTVGSVSVTSSSAGKLTVKWGKVKNAYRYQVVIARNSGFTRGVSKSLVSSTSKTFTKLKQGCKYYVKVRAVRKVNGKSRYGKYSKVKTCVVRKSSSSSTKPGLGTVYWTPSGTVYHSTKNCPTLARSRTIYSGSIAQSGRSRRCKVC